MPYRILFWLNNFSFKCNIKLIRYWWKSGISGQITLSTHCDDIRVLWNCGEKYKYICYMCINLHQMLLPTWSVLLIEQKFWNKSTEENGDIGFIMPYCILFWLNYFSFKCNIKLIRYWWKSGISCQITLLTHCGLVMPYSDIDLGQHWFWWWHQALTWSKVELIAVKSPRHSPESSFRWNYWKSITQTIKPLT